MVQIKVAVCSGCRTILGENAMFIECGHLYHQRCLPQCPTMCSIDNCKKGYRMIDVITVRPIYNYVGAEDDPPPPTDPVITDEADTEKLVDLRLVNQLKVAEANHSKNAFLKLKDLEIQLDSYNDKFAEITTKLVNRRSLGNWEMFERVAFVCIMAWIVYLSLM